MADTTLRIDREPPEPTGNRFTTTSVILLLLPLVLLAGVLALIVATDAGLGDRETPPIETLNIPKVTLPEPGQIELEIVNDGPDPITIAQVLVDEAYWQFTIEPGNTLDRLDSATIAIPYPWVKDEAHAISMISETGVVFEAEIPVAIQSPQTNVESFTRFALVGFYVGVIPVSLGLLWYPSMQRLGRKGMSFILALTVGLLVFLAFDMWEEARKVALGVAGAFDAPVLIPVLVLLTVAFLMLVGQLIRGKTGDAKGVPLAYQIATGIGLHNMGEGLAIGAAFALGEAALGVFLIIGFTLHNVTEGVGIASPMVKDRPAWRHFVLLAMIAGAPAIVGVWIGAFVFSPLWTTVFLAIGIGAIVQVVIDVSRLILRDQQRADEPAITWPTFGGFAAGLAVMYLTALLVAA
ncbi:MAG: ZIP family metal transporter [Thermomicrobiales bacterium]